MEQAKNMARIAYKALSEKKANDIVILDIAQVTPIADYFVICDANNVNQLSALTDEVEDKMYEAGYTQQQREGQKDSPWVLLDFGDVIVHIFDKENRDFYNLERIWADGKRVDIEEL